MTVTKDIKKLESAFNALNEKFYSGKLSRPVIHYYPDRSKKALGWITAEKKWTSGDARDYEINICANGRRGTDVYETLLHEMAHLYALMNGISDTSNHGFYHNAEYKKIAEVHGLKVEKIPRYGWSRTSLNDDASLFVCALEPLDCFYEPDVATLPANEKKKGNSFKHVCPSCGAIARTSKPGVNLVCGDCYQPMDEE